MEPKSSLLCSQKPVTGPYRDPMNPFDIFLLISPRSVLILSSHVRLDPGFFFIVRSFELELEDHPLSAANGCLFNIHSYLPYLPKPLNPISN
jgi:hypothetical protein